MNIPKRLLMEATLGILSASVCLAATQEGPSALDVVARFMKTKESMTSFAMEVRVDSSFAQPVLGRRRKRSEKFQYRFDGTRGRVNDYAWGTVGRISNVPEEKAHYISSMWDGEDRYDYRQGWRGARGKLVLARSEEWNATYRSKTIVQDSHLPGLMMGYVRLGVAGYRLDDLLGSHEHLTLRQERVRGVTCYVLDADVEGKGRFTLWIDPTHDYQAAKVRVQTRPGDSVPGIPGVLLPNNSNETILEVTEFQKIDGMWIPKKYTTQSKVRLNGDAGWARSIGEITDFELNPDHEALQSFIPYDIPDGTPVTIVEDFPPDVKFTWRDGKVVKQRN